MLNRKTIIIALGVVAVLSAGYYYFFYGNPKGAAPVGSEEFIDESTYIDILSVEEKNSLNEYRQLKRIKIDLAFLNNPFFKELKDIIPRQPPGDPKGRQNPFLSVGGLAGASSAIAKPVSTTTPVQR